MAAQSAFTAHSPPGAGEAEAEADGADEADTETEADSEAEAEADGSAEEEAAAEDSAGAEAEAEGASEAGAEDDGSASGKLHWYCRVGFWGSPSASPSEGEHLVSSATAIIDAIAHSRSTGTATFGASAIGEGLTAGACAELGGRTIRVDGTSGLLSGEEAVQMEGVGCSAGCERK